MDSKNLQSIAEAYISIYEKAGGEDHEVSMIRAQLHSIMKSCESLMENMQGGEKNIEAWVQAKITSAESMLQAAANYIDSGESKVNEESEMNEAWYSGKGQYRTTVSGRRVRWDEDDATDNRVSDMLQRRREEARKSASQQRMREKGTVPKKDGKDIFEHILEYLVAEGYADTNENALVIMANMSEEWREEIVEAAVRNRGLVDSGGLNNPRKDLANKAIDASGRTVPTHPKGLRMIPTHHSAARLPSGELKTKARNKARKDAYYQNQRYGQGSI